MRPSERLSFFVTAIVIAALYLILVASFERPEVIAAGVTGVIAALIVGRVSRRSPVDIRLRIRWLASLRVYRCELPKIVQPS